jgi:hypothetical protein
MKTTQLAVVWPIPELPQNTNQIHQEIWTRTANLLKPGLGMLFDSFYPASRAWGIPLNAFGVLLGRDAPAACMGILAAASEVRDAAIDFHINGLLAGVNPDQMRTKGDAIICPVYLDGTDKELEAHSLWQLCFFSGVPMPDCGIYYAQQQRSLAGPEQIKTIASHLAGYAVCVAMLEIREDGERANDD